jgi:hypothetical protein
MEKHPRPLVLHQAGAEDTGLRRDVLNRHTLILAAKRCSWTISAEAGQSFQSSLPDTPNGNCHLLLTRALAVESLAALAKVVEPRSGRTIL